MQILRHAQGLRTLKMCCKVLKWAFTIFSEVIGFLYPRWYDLSSLRQIQHLLDKTRAGIEESFQ